MSSIAMSICHKCSTEIPESNKILHDLRCKGGSDGAAGSQGGSSSALTLTTQKGRIPSDFEYLDKIHEILPWVPNSSQCRPSPIAREKKERLLEQVRSEWRSLTDYVYHVELECPYEIHDDGKKAVEHRGGPESLFKPNTFPYNTGVPNARHYVLWYRTPHRDAKLTDDVINSHIEAFISSYIDDDAIPFQYAWYENPNMTVPDIYHLQVFWTHF